VGDKSGDEFARVGPDSAERVSCDENAHGTPTGRGLGKPRTNLFLV